MHFKKGSCRFQVPGLPVCLDWPCGGRGQEHPQGRKPADTCPVQGRGRRAPRWCQEWSGRQSRVERALCHFLGEERLSHGGDSFLRHRNGPLTPATAKMPVVTSFWAQV